MYSVCDVIIMSKDDIVIKNKIENPYMCMSCGNCKRTANSLDTFKFACAHGEFPIDAVFAARIEVVGCKAWIPSSKYHYEPWVIEIDAHYRKMQLGKHGKKFVDLYPDEIEEIYNATDDDGEWDFGKLESVCRESYGEE